MEYKYSYPLDGKYTPEHLKEILPEEGNALDYTVVWVGEVFGFPDIKNHKCRRLSLALDFVKRAGQGGIAKGKCKVIGLFYALKKGPEFIFYSWQYGSDGYWRKEISTPDSF